MSRLIVTNGQSGIDSIMRAGIDGEVFSWDDVLHDGPVPGGYELAVLSELRARYIASVGYATFEEAHQKFVDRDQKLIEAAYYDELVLCFEHDLYDQLQLIQILFLLSHELNTPPLITQAYPPTYITSCTDAELQESFERRQEITTAVFSKAVDCWEAFTSESPEAITVEITDPAPGLPHLSSAMQRLAEEYPDYKTGLSRTEAQILSSLQNGSMSFGPLFKTVQASEEAMFMGDASFMIYLEALCQGDEPIVITFDGAGEKAQPINTEAKKGLLFEMTAAGRAVLHGEAFKTNFVDIDRWIGGTHVDAANLWRWNPDKGVFLR